MAVAASLNVVISAHTAQFQEGMKKAEKALKSIDKAAENTGRIVQALGTIKMVAASVGGVALAKSIGSATVAMVENLKATTEFADRLGMSVNSLRALRMTADQAGSSAEVMDAALKRMKNTLGEARMGSESARKALDGIGASAAYITNINADQAFALIASRINAISDPLRKAAVIQDIFGRSAEEMATVLEEMGKNMPGIYERLAADGRSFTDSQLEGVKRAGDALDNLSSKWEGFKERFAVNTAEMTAMAADFFAHIFSPQFMAPLNGWQAGVKVNSPTPMPEMMKRFTDQNDRRMSVMDLFNGKAVGDLQKKAERLGAVMAEGFAKKHAEAVARVDARKEMERIGGGLNAAQLLTGAFVNWAQTETAKRPAMVGPASSITAGSQANAVFEFNKRQQADQAKILKPQEKANQLLTRIAQGIDDLRRMKPVEFDL